MLELFRAKLVDGCGEVGIAVADLGQLLGLMAVDLGLYRLGAGHCGFFRLQGRRRAEREARYIPDRLMRGRAHAAFRDHAVEALEVALLLPSHARDQLGAMRIGAEHRHLAGVNAGSAIFAGLVDA
jgi:hypothetical protein